MRAPEIASEIEWELFARPRAIRDLVGVGLPDGTEVIELYRDEGYSLGAAFSGYSSTGIAPSIPMPPAGTPVTGTEMRGTDRHHDDVVLSGLLIRKQTTELFGPAKGRLTGTLSLQEAYLYRESPDSRPTVLVEWYLNGPTEQSLFSRPTERELNVRFRRARYIGESGPRPTAGISQSSSGTSVDHALIDVGPYKFLVAEVPSGHGPTWSHSLSIEYRADLGSIPDEPTREAISEAISFVLGRQLLLIGSTDMDNEGNPISAKAQSPWGDGVADLCSQHSVPPVHVYNVFERLFEPVASFVTRSYLTHRDMFGLKGAMWNYWLARRAPIGPNLVFMAAAMESLMKGWFASGRSPSSGLDMPQEEFEELIGPELQAIQDKLKPHPMGARTARRIRRAFTMGVNDSFETFFKELGITLTDLESAALRRRNVSAHGGGVPGEARRLAEHLRIMEEMHETQAQYRAYETLFHRVMLTLLGYQGAYVDYSVTGHPSRALHQV